MARRRRRASAGRHAGEGANDPGTPPPAPPPIRHALSRKHERTRTALFARPTRASIAWGDVVALLEALGATKTTKGGSMFAFTLNERRIVLHKPHPGHELVKGAVEAVRDFLTQAGAAP